MKKIDFPPYLLSDSASIGITEALFTNGHFIVPLKHLSAKAKQEAKAEAKRPNVQPFDIQRKYFDSIPRHKKDRQYRPTGKLTRSDVDGNMWAEYSSGDGRILIQCKYAEMFQADVVTRRDGSRIARVEAFTPPIIISIGSIRIECEDDNGQR